MDPSSTERERGSEKERDTRGEQGNAPVRNTLSPLDGAATTLRNRETHSNLELTRRLKHKPKHLAQNNLNTAAMQISLTTSVV